jgi:cell division initiation protein
MDQQKPGITPVELRNRQFAKKMRGLDPVEVDDIVRLAADSLESALIRIDSLSSDVRRLEERVHQFERLEASIKEALVTAQSVVDEIKKNASKEAELVKRQAQIDASKFTEIHERRMAEIKAQTDRLRSFRDEYVIKLKSLIAGHQEMIDKLADDHVKFDISEPKS